MVARSSANFLLQSLPLEEWDKLSPSLRSVHLNRGDIIAESERTIAQVYFPETCVVSTISVFQSGTTCEMATTGREGFSPIGAALGAEKAIARHVVQVPGLSMVVGKRQFDDAHQKLPVFRSLMLNCLQAFLGQILQSVACNAYHSVEERYARWLLMTHDRAATDTFALTQEFLSEMLAVSRPSVNAASRKLQDAGLISYRRGAITILDRKKLERVSCECYEVIRRLYASRLGAELSPTSRRRDQTISSS
jgi:Crp-like helix-turn-helix domain